MIKLSNLHWSNTGGWFQLNIKNVENYIEFDEKGNILLVENNLGTLDINQVNINNQILNDITNAKDELSSIVNELNKYI